MNFRNWFNWGRQQQTPLPSIYQTLKEQVVDGVLDSGYQLPESSMVKSGVRFAPGAQDGIRLYNFSSSASLEAVHEGLHRAFKVLTKGKVQEAIQKFEHVLRDYPVSSMLSDLAQHFSAVQDHLDVEMLLSFVMNDLIIKGQEVELVKLGLYLRSWVSPYSSQECDVIRTLGLHEEFTLFAIMNMQRWPDGQEAIFQLAKKVSGWGRIHAISALEAESKEVKDWLVEKGYHNTVMPEYTALDCYHKGQVFDRLKDPQLDETMFSGITGILQALLNEGSVLGLSTLGNDEEVLSLYLEQCQRFSLTISQYELLFAISTYDDEFVAVNQEARRLLESQHCQQVVKAAVEKGEGISLAQSLGLLHKEQIVMGLSTHFDRFKGYLSYLADDEAAFDQGLDLFRQHLDWDNLPELPHSEVRFGAFELALHELRHYVNKGEDFLYKGLMSSAINNRNASLRTLKSWVDKSQRPLKDLSPKLYHRLREAEKLEPEADVRKRMQALLSEQFSAEKTAR